MKSIIFYIMLVCFFVQTLTAQEFMKVPVEQWIYEEVSFPKDAFFINEKLFLEGQDHTAILQDIFDQYKVVVLPKGVLNINHNGLYLKDSSKLYFQKGSVLKMIPNDKEKYSILNINRINDVSIFNPQLVGDRESHKGLDGEWGMGITIRSSRNINIINANIINMWGDAIYIGKAGKTKEVNYNIYIQGGVIDYTRRNGISVTSGKKIKIENTAIYNIYGVKPMEGIDIEPNKNSVVITDIKLSNIKTYNNGFAGIAIALDHLRHLDVSTTRIEIKNHIDKYSKYGFRMGYLRHAQGEVNVSDSKWCENKNGPLYFSNIYVSSFQVNFKNNYMDNMKAVTKEVAKYYTEKNRPKSIRLKNYNFN